MLAMFALLCPVVLLSAALASPAANDRASWAVVTGASSRWSPAAVPIVLEGTIVQSTPYTCGAPLMPPPYYGAPQTASPLPGGGMYPGAGYPHEPAGAQPLVLMGQVVQ